MRVMLRTMSSLALADDSNPLPASAGPAPREAAEAQAPAWRLALKRAVRDPRELIRILRLPSSLEEGAVRAARDFPLLAPRGYIARMKPGDPSDPLLRQVLPLESETTPVAGYTPDPVGDGPATAAAGLIRKYQGRALIVTTGACAVHCRYCFRRHFPYSERARTWDEWDRTLAHLAQDPSVHEVILSGGDPLTLSDAWLAEFVEKLAAIPHLRRLRVHTRLPIMIPERVSDDLLAWLKGTRLTPWMVIHANHPAEIDRDVADALSWLVDSGVPVLNQAVLLRGVNDDATILEELCERLVDLRVTPYYLHQLDRVSGAAHFETSEETGQGLISALRERLPGYAVPRYARETPGAPHKTILA